MAWIVSYILFDSHEVKPSTTPVFSINHHQYVLQKRISLIFREEFVYSTNNTLPSTLPPLSHSRIIAMVDPPPPYSPSAPPPVYVAPGSQPAASTPRRLPRDLSHPSSVSNPLPEPLQPAQSSSSPLVRVQLPNPPTPNPLLPQPQLAYAWPPQPPASGQIPMAYISQTPNQQTTPASTAPARNTTASASQARSTRAKSECPSICCLCLGCYFDYGDFCGKLSLIPCACLCCPCAAYAVLTGECDDVF